MSGRATKPTINCLPQAATAASPFPHDMQSQPAAGDALAAVDDVRDGVRIEPVPCAAQMAHPTNFIEHETAALRDSVGVADSTAPRLIPTHAR